MGLTVQERARLTSIWRSLATECLRAAGNSAAADVEGLKRRASEATSWASPFEDQSDAYALFALARLAVSFTRARGDQRRAQRAPGLTSLSLLALDLLPGGAPAPSPSPPGLPFRADLDG